MTRKVEEMSDEQRRAMFARLNGGGSGATRRNPYEVTNPTMGEKAGAFLSGFASGALEGLGNIGSVLTFKPLRDKWEDDFYRNNEGRRIAEAEARAAKAEREAKKYKPTAEEKKAGKPHPMQAAVAADLYYNPPELPQRPDPIPKPQHRAAADIVRDIYGDTDPGAAAAESARSFEEQAAKLRGEIDGLKGMTFERPEAPATKRGNLQQARREAAAKPGATSASIIAAVEKAKEQNAQASQWKKELRKAMKGAKTQKQFERAEEQARKNFFADYNAALDAIGRQERARDTRVQSLEKAITSLETEARKATERAEAARQRQEVQKEKDRQRIEAQQKRELRAWERDRARQERDYQKAVAQAKREAVRERRQEYKTEKKETSAYVKALHEGKIAPQEELRPGAPHGENKEFYELMGHFYPKNWKDKGQTKAWYMALGVVNDLVKSGELANRRRVQAAIRPLLFHLEFSRAIASLPA